MHCILPHSSAPARPVRPVVICFSHLRWDLVFQRPQHLMSRLSAGFDVIYWEEPQIDPACKAPRLNRMQIAPGLARIVPVLPARLDDAAHDEALARLLTSEVAHRSGPLVFWYYTPMMLALGARVAPDLVVYDCMDELANFAFAPADIAAREAELMARADIVLCGGRSLYEARRGRHGDIHCYPSGVDIAHFARDPAAVPDPVGQAGLPRPRLGFYGVIDERMDLDLIAQMAQMRPDWSFVMIGPVVKINPAGCRAPPIFTGSARATMPACPIMRCTGTSR